MNDEGLLFAAIDHTYMIFTDPLWKQKILDLLNSGELSEDDIAEYVFGTSYKYKYVCPTTTVNEIIYFTKLDSDNE